MSIADMIRRMSDAGATPEAIAIAVEILEEQQNAFKAKEAARLAKDAERTRKRRQLGPEVTPELRSRVMARDGNKCVDCGATELLQCDHIVPISKGGPTTFENLQILCKSCNSRKRDRLRKADERRTGQDKRGQKKDSPADTAPSEPLSSSLLPREEKSSEAIASAQAVRPMDVTELLWSEGPEHLVAMGVPEKHSKSNIGRWRSAGHADATILDAIRRARDMGSKDPIPLVGRILKPVGKPNAKAGNIHPMFAALDRLEDEVCRGGEPELRLVSSAGGDRARPPPNRLLSDR